MGIVLEDGTQELLGIHRLRRGDSQCMANAVGAGIEDALITFHAVLPQYIADGAGIGIVEFGDFRKQGLIALAGGCKNGVGKGNLAVEFDHRGACHHVAKPLPTWRKCNRSNGNRTIKHAWIHLQKSENPAQKVVSDVGGTAIDAYDLDAHGHLPYTLTPEKPFAEQMIEQTRHRRQRYRTRRNVPQCRSDNECSDQHVHDDDDNVDQPRQNTVENRGQFVLDFDILRCGYFDFGHCERIYKFRR
ncbi:MAG: hypothetical protein RLZZ519_500 [Bacteroidota bacterium]